MKPRYDSNPKGPRDIETVSMLSASGSLEEYSAAQHISGSWKRIILLALAVIVPLGLPFFLYLYRWLLGN